MPAHHFVDEVFPLLALLALKDGLSEPASPDRVDSLIADDETAKNPQELRPLSFSEFGQHQHLPSGQALLGKGHEGEGELELGPEGGLLGRGVYHELVQLVDVAHFRELFPVDPHLEGLHPLLGRLFGQETPREELDEGVAVVGFAHWPQQLPQDLLVRLLLQLADRVLG